MSRPHVEFLQSQTLPWVTAPWSWLAGCQTKVLSEDEDSGAVTALVRFAPEWSAPVPGYLDVNEEFLVLEGTVSVNGRRYEQDCYAYLPAGYPQRALGSEQGGVAIAFFSGRAHWRRGTPASGAFRLDGLVEFLDAYAMDWQEAAGETGGARVKVLRGSTRQNEATMLVTTPPHRHPPAWHAPQERHACAEEMFLLGGDYQSSVGIMHSGAYYWAPPAVAHGPYGTRAGSLALMRTLGAPLDHQRTTHELTLTRSPQYAPVLPPDLAARHASPWRPQYF